MNARARFRSAVRLLLVYLLYYSGLLHALKRRRLRGRAVVLMYHRVLTAAERLQSFSSDGIQVSPDTFDRQLGFLRRHFNVVEPREFARRLQFGLGFDDATCLITFDDGWHDNLTNALPLLRKHALPAVIFLPTALIGSNDCFWQERLARLLHRLSHVQRRDPSSVAALVQRYDLKSVFQGSDVERKQRIHDFVRALKVLADDEIQAMMRAIAAAVGTDDADEHPDRFLQWDDVRAMARAGVTFGSHAVSHRILTRLPNTEVMRELAESKRTIETHAGVAVDLLAYPNGDSNEAIADAAKSAGYLAAFTTQAGLVAADDDRFLVRRVNIHDRATRTLPGFYSVLLGVI